MDFFQLTMRILSGLLMVYFLLIMFRVILSWIPNTSQGTSKIRDIVSSITDPYMKRFRGISWLRFGMLDFSPILGFAVLSFVLFLTQRLSTGTLPSVGELIAWVISMAWGIVAFLATILAITMIVRLITLYTMKGRRTAFMDKLDAFLFPKVARMMGFFTHKTVNYPLALGICAASLLAARVLIGWGLTRLLSSLLLL